VPQAVLAEYQMSFFIPGAILWPPDLILSPLFCFAGALLDLIT